MTESIYAKICYQINNKYINDPNSPVKHDLNLEPITIYDHYDPEIAKYLRILLNYYVLHKKSDAPLPVYQSDSKDPEQVALYNFLTDFNSLNGTEYDGPVVNVVTLQLLLKGLSTGLPVTNETYSDEFSTSYRNLIDILGAYATNDILLPEINVLFSDDQLKLIDNSDYSKKIQEIQKAINYEFTDFSDIHNTNLALAFKYGLQSPNGIKNDKLIYDLGLAYQSAIGVEPVVWDNAYIINDLPCGSGGLKYVQYAAFLKDYTKDPNSIGMSFVTNAHLRQMFNVNKTNIHNLRMTRGVRLNGLDNDVVQAFYINRSANDKIYVLQRVGNTTKISWSNYSEMSEDFHKITFESNSVVLEGNLFGHTQTLAPMKSNTSTYFLVGVHGEVSSHSNIKWSRELALINLMTPNLTYSSLDELPRITGFNKYYRVEATTSLNDNRLIIQGVTDNGTGEFKMYDLHDTFEQLQNHDVVNVSSLHQLGTTVTIPNITDKEKGIGSLQGLSYLNNKLFISSQKAPIITDVSKYNKWLFALNNWPRQIVEIDWSSPSKSNWTYIPVTNLKGHTIKSLFEQFNIGTHNFATELENVNVLNENQCDLIIDYHGVTEFGDQTLDDEAFLVRLEWSN